MSTCFNEPALRRGPIWKNANLIVRGEDRRPLLVDGEPVPMESPIKVASVDQFTPLQSTALTNVGYEPKFTNDVFAFRETVTEMQQLLDRGKMEATKKEPPKPKITEDCHQEALAAAQAPMFISKSSNIQVVLPSGAEAVDPVKYRVFLGVTENQGEEAAMASTGTLAKSPQGTAATKAMPIPANTATDKDDANPRCSPTCLCEVLGEMNNSLEHLETGYFNCFNKTVTATREVLVEVNEIDVTYIDAVLEAMTKWQATVSLAITDMHTDNCIMWDTKRYTLDEATRIFGEVCEANCIKCANAHEAHHKAVVEGDKKNPVVELLDWVLVKTREAANLAVAAFQKQFEEALVPHMPAEHLPVLVSCAYSTMSQFRMTIWRMVADECIMPMWHNYLTSFGLATVMQHALEKIPSTCMRIVPPHPPEPKDDLTTFLDSLGNTLASRTPAAHAGMPAAPFSSILPVPGVLPTRGSGVGPVPATAIPVFGGAPLAPVPASVLTGVSLFQTSSASPPGFAPLPASVSVASTSSTPAAVSTPKASGSAITLLVSIPLEGHPGGRSDFLTDPIQAGSLADLEDEGDTMLDDDLRKMARDISQKHTTGNKHAHDKDLDEEEEGEDGDSSIFEDLDEVAPPAAKENRKS